MEDRTGKELFEEIAQIRRGLEEAGRTLRSLESAESDRGMLERLVDELPGFVYLRTADYRIRYANRVFLETFGEYEGRTCHQVIRGRPEPCEGCPSLLNDGRPVQWELTLPGGRTFQVYDCSFTDIDGSPLVLEFAMDVTALKKAEDEAAGHRRLLEAFFENTISPMVLLDRDFNFLRVNKAYADGTGRAISEFAGRNHFEIYPSDAQAIFEEVVATKKPFQVLARPFVFPDHPEWGVTYWDWTLVPIPDPEGQVEFLVFSLKDVTARIRAQQSLRESEEKYHALVEMAGDAIFVADAETGVIIEANRKAEELTGVPRERLVGMHQSRLHPREEREAYAELFREDVRKGASERKFHVQRPDGGRVPVDIRTATLELGGRKVIQGIFRDITERREAEEKLRALEQRLVQSEKMEAIGQFASGIAHEFNNRLAAIMNFASVAMMKMPGDDPLREYLANIVESSRRAAGLTQSLLAFSRQQEVRPAPVSLGGIVGAVQREVRAAAGESVEVVISPNDVEVVVLAEAAKVEDVVINLVRNALDAMPGGGRLSIGTGVAELSADSPGGPGPGRTGRFGFVSVADTGVGMDAATLKRIFEPFFTTKEFGRGTGLGLAISYGIIMQHEGCIDVRSEPGKGSTFRVCLPLAGPGAPGKPQECGTDSGELPRGSGTILVAEDDAAVRLSLREMLEGQGYEVLEASDGGEAVRMLGEDDGRVRLAVVDVRMPGMGGIEACDRMRRTRPAIKVLFMSGHAAEVGGGEGVRFISKPFSRGEFLRAVGEILEG
jgi:two-component system cell cycle sensor histidine kinase/response regulator CckA